MSGSITSIGYAAFSRLRRLIEVSLPDMLRSRFSTVGLAITVVGVLALGSYLLTRAGGTEEQVALEFDASSPPITLNP